MKEGVVLSVKSYLKRTGKKENGKKQRANNNKIVDQNKHQYKKWRNRKFFQNQKAATSISEQWKATKRRIVHSCQL